MAFLGDILQGGVEVAGMLDQINRNRELGEYADEQATAIGQQASDASQFKPYGVTSGLGSAQATAEGGIDFALSPEQQAQADQRFAQSGAFFDRASGGINELTGQRYSEMQDVMAPARERERLALEARLHAQGRLGVGGAAYGGGNPEMFGLAQANREADARAYQDAYGYAQSQQRQNAELGGMLQQAGFAPTQQMGNLYGLGTETARLQQAGQLGGASYLTQGRIAGLESKINAEKLATDAYANLFATGGQLAGQVGNWAQNMITGAGSSTSNAIEDLIEGKIKEWF